MKHCCAVLALASLAACGGGGGNGPAANDFQAFVIEQITENTLETNEPQDINGIDFQFDESEDAFAELFLP